MVPSRGTVEDVRVAPLASVKVKDNEVSELGLRVPSTIGVHLAVDNKDGVTTTADRGRLGLLYRLILVPSMSLEVEAEDISISRAGITDTTVTSVDVDLVLVVGGSHVGSGAWGANL